MKDGIHIKRDKSRAPAKSKYKAGKIIGIIAGAVVVLVIAGAIGTGVYVNKLDTVYPNVFIGGIKLSGLTLDEAQKALTDAGYDKNAANIAATIDFPDGKQMTVTGEQAGLKLQTDKAAQAAFRFGRGGSFVQNELNYIKSMFNKNDLSATTSVDEKLVRDIVSDFTKQFNDKLLKSAYTITDKSIELVKGSGGALADEDDVLKLTIATLDQSASMNSPASAEYTLSGSNGGVDLKALYNTIHKEPVDAIYDKATNLVSQSAAGVSFDVSAAQRVLDAAKTGTTVTIPLVHTEPKVSTAQLQSTLFRDILSEKTTDVGGSSNRLNNVALAASTVNGTVLNPGDTFSYNNTLGQRTPEKGYKEAGAYANGEVVQEVGGGICQVSSTLYYCVLYADLKVVDRSNHMFVVTYLPLGDDATVSWGGPDFKFMNSTAYPIRIEVIYKNYQLTIRIRGTKTDTNRVEVSYVLLETKQPKEVKKEDPSVAPGTTKVDQGGMEGYVVDSYKYIYDASGKLLSKTYINRSSYDAENRIILVPVGTLTSPSASISPSASASLSPSVSPSKTPSPSPSASISPSPSASTSPSPSASASPSPSPSPSTSVGPLPSTSHS